MRIGLLSCLGGLNRFPLWNLTPFGLMPHDLDRDAIATELRWRNPDRYSVLHHKARGYHSDRLDQAKSGAVSS